MLALLAFLVVHVTMVVTTGLLTNLRAMITGWRHPAAAHSRTADAVHAEASRTTRHAS